MRRTMITIIALVLLMPVMCVPAVLAGPQPIQEVTEDVAPLNELDPGHGGGGYGNVTFMIGHSCTASWVGVRPWILGRASHWDMFNNRYSMDFWHQAGYEVASFSGVPAGPSRGEARIVVGFGTCTSCSTGVIPYTVPLNATHVEPMTMTR